MANPADPITDPKRLAALRRAGLLDSPPEEVFDRLASAAARIMEAPVGLVSLVDEDRQFFKSSTSPSGTFGAERESPLTHSLCRHAVASLEPLILPDARSHPDYRAHPAVQDLDVAAYAGFPIILQDGQAIGTVCVLDTRPRQWGEQQIETLRGLARDAAGVVARQAAATDAKAWRSAAKAGLSRGPSASEGAVAAGTGLEALPFYLQRLDRSPPPPGAGAPSETEDGLAAAVLFYLRQVDAYVQSLNVQGTPPGGDSARQDRFRAAVVSAEAALFRALEAFDLQRTVPAPAAQDADTPGRRQPAAVLRDRCAAFLDAEQRRSRTSLMFRRSLVPLGELERAVTASSEAEQAMRLALHDYRMQRG